LFFFQAEDGIRDFHVTGVQTCALPIYSRCGLQAHCPSPDYQSAESGSRSRYLRTSLWWASYSRFPESSRFAPWPWLLPYADRHKIGRASCRERVKIPVVVGAVARIDMR